MKMNRISLTAIALIFALGLLGASPLTISSIQMEGRMPIAETFRVLQSEDALNFNLVESRNSTVKIGSYTITSNDSSSQFHLFISPGADGKQDRFAFVLDSGFTAEPGQLSTLPITVRIVSDTAGAVSVAGADSVDKNLGVRGVYSNNQDVLYESGEILAEIPDFNPDIFASGWYSAAIQLRIQVI